MFNRINEQKIIDDRLRIIKCILYFIFKLYRPTMSSLTLKKNKNPQKMAKIDNYTTLDNVIRL